MRGVPRKPWKSPGGKGAARSRRRARDLLSIVEAVYALESSSEKWMDDLLGAVDDVLGMGLPAIAFGVQAHQNGTLTIDRSLAAARRHPPQVVEAILDGLSSAPPGWLKAYVRKGGGVVRALLTSEADPDAKLSYRARLARDGVRDGLNIACADLDNRGVIISLALPKLATIDAESRADMVRVGTHVLAGLRLRRQLGFDMPGARVAAGAGGAASLARPGSNDGVLSPDGDLVSEEPQADLASARRVLRSAVRDVERARGALRGDSREALKLWRGLVGARWTLIDAFDDADGKRCIVARENAPRTSGIAHLTPTERLVVSYAVRGLTTKEIAYALGLSDVTVRVLMMRAARRCGARNREQLLRQGRAAALQGDNGAPAPDGPPPVARGR